MNVQRVRHRIDERKRALLPSGTTANEAMHSQINRWLRNLGEVHAETVQQQLDVCQLGCLMTRNAALFRPWLYQQRHAELLVFEVRRLRFSAAQWQSLCATESLPGNVAKETTRELLRKRPAAAMKKRPLKRTPFTRERKRAKTDE